MNLNLSVDKIPPACIESGRRFVERYFNRKLSEFDHLAHHGIKGQKWGVRNGPPYPLSRQKNKKSSDESTGLNTPTITEPESKYYKRITGRGNPPPKSEPGSIIDKVYDDGKVVIRSFYGEDGRKKTDLHLTDHRLPNIHPYGEHGEHAHDYTWYYDNDKKKWCSNKTTREITEEERKENDDII